MYDVARASEFTYAYHLEAKRLWAPIARNTTKTFTYNYWRPSGEI